MRSCAVRARVRGNPKERKAVPKLYAALEGMSRSLLKRATGRCWFARFSGKDIGFKLGLICMLDVASTESGTQ
jgi:hypothetical protein